MPTASDLALWDIMPDLVAEDALLRPAVEEYLAAAEAPKELSDAERFKTQVRLFEFYRHFCRVHLSFPVIDLAAGQQKFEVDYNYQMLLSAPLWKVQPKFPGATRYWFHQFTGLVAAESTLVQYGSPDPYLDAIEERSAHFAPSFDPPRLLFRGQRQQSETVSSPMARALLGTDTEGFRIRVLGWDVGLTQDFSDVHKFSGHPPYWEEITGVQVPLDMGQILARFTLHLSMNMRIGLHVPWQVSSEDFPFKPVLMTPFHLTLFQGQHSSEQAGEMAQATGMRILSDTMRNLPNRFIKEYVAHLTDYELPVPVVGRGGIVRDFVPNPFVSTSSNFRTALLYASGYFNSFSDKLNVDWKEVYDLCRSDGNKGVVYALRVGRPVLPVTREAGAETIGAAEAEFAVPGLIAPDEIEAVIPVRDLIKRTDLGALESYLDGEGAKEPDGELQWRFVNRN